LIGEGLGSDGELTARESSIDRAFVDDTVAGKRITDDLGISAGMSQRQIGPQREHRPRVGRVHIVEVTVIAGVLAQIDRHTVECLGAGSVEIAAVSRVVDRPRSRQPVLDGDRGKVGRQIKHTVHRHPIQRPTVPL